MHHAEEKPDCLVPMGLLQEDEKILRKLLQKVRASAEQVRPLRPGLSSSEAAELRLRSKTTVTIQLA
jgi:hypothetical protein